MNDQIVELQSNFGGLTPDEASAPTRHLVLLLHGILSKSDRWVETHIAVSGRFQDLDVTPVPISYELVYPWDLFNGKSEEKSTLVANRIKQAIEMTPHDVLSIQCHSYGTKVFSRLPESIRLSFDWVFFAGSICHENDDRVFEKHTVKIINDCGKSDIFPVIAQSIHSNLYSQTGKYGFHNPPIFDRFFNYGHSDATNIRHFEDWIIPVLRTGQIAIAEPPCSRWAQFAPDALRWLLRSVGGIAAVYWIFF